MRFFASVASFAFFAVMSVLISGLIVGCSHSNRSVDTKAASSPTYQAALKKAFAEVEQNSERRPAQAQVGITLAELNKVKPGKFKVFVFPKLQSKALKSKSDDKALFKDAKAERLSQLGKPAEYEVSTVAENPCHQFIEKGLFAKLGAKAYFDASLAADKSRRCAIIEVTSVKMREANKALIRRDDVLRNRLFIDDAYRLHGYDLEKYTDGQNLVTVRFKSDGLQGASSGLSLFPVDIPALDVLQKSSAQRSAVNVAAKVDRLALTQIRKQMGAFEAVNCQGTEVKYSDYFGARVQVSWCDGVPFPQVMENSRFIAITQPLSVR